MQPQDAVVVVTGGGSGIGPALARRFSAEGAAAVVVSDRDGDAAQRVAAEIGGTADTTDVTDEAAVAALVARTLEAHGRVDLFCSNAGVFSGGGVETPTGVWQQVFAVNVLAHVYAARAVLPSMLERGSGYLLNVASAAARSARWGWPRRCCSTRSRTARPRPRWWWRRGRSSRPRTWRRWWSR